MSNVISNESLTKFQAFVLLVFAFMIGMVVGWVIEVLFRHFNDKKRKWYNPGFCVGPWLPIYGFALVIIYSITWVEYLLPHPGEIQTRIILFVIMSLCITSMELIAGTILKNTMNVRLWDYSKEWLNYKGYICPKFSFFWVLLAAVYYFTIHYKIYDSLKWLATHFEFSFVIGFFFAIFIVDVIYSSNIATRLIKVAKDENIVVALEDVKDKFRRKKAIGDAKYAFFLFMDKPSITKDIIWNE